MSNGFGAGFFAITLLAVLAGLAILVVLATIGTVVLDRRTGYFPTLLRYLVVVIGVGVLGITGFGILLLSDEAPAAAWLFTSIVVAPLLIVSVYLARTTAFARLDVVVLTVMAWGVPFFLGVGVVFGVMNGIDLVFDLAPAESRQLGVAWIAAASGGLTIILSMLPIGSRLSEMLYATTAPSESP